MARPRSILYVVDPETQCWIWAGAVSWSGYGRVRRDGRLQWAHRWFFEQSKGMIPSGMQLDHLCRNKLCVNVEHLEVVTPAENQRRGNARRLDWELVAFIRENSERMTDRELAAFCGVSHSCVQGVRDYRSWRDEESQSS